MLIKDRIRELRRVRAGDLKPNPKNWRKHPQAQQDALRGVLAEIGYADALIARELPDGSLMLLDGHLRAETTPDSIVPVLVVDLDDAEAEKLLLTLDPLASMAQADEEALAKLLKSVETDSAAVQAMLDAMAREAGIPVSSNGVLPDEPPPLDRAAELQAKWGTATGQLWTIGAHRLLCGDSTKAEDVARVMGGEKAILMSTDPPYGVDFAGGKYNPKAKKWDAIEGDNIQGENLRRVLTCGRAYAVGKRKQFFVLGMRI